MQGPSTDRTFAPAPCQKADDAPSRLQQYRDRLSSLRKRREALETTPQAAPRGPKVAGARGPVPGMKGAQPGSKAGLNGQLLTTLRPGMLMRVYDLLTADVTDRSEMVPNTPFSVDGVGKLMLKLRQRVDQEDHEGAAVAAGFVNFLAADDNDPDAIGGASLEKLQELAAMAARLQGGRG